MSIKISGARFDRDEIVLNEFSLALIEKLHIELNPRRKELLKENSPLTFQYLFGSDEQFVFVSGEILVTVNVSDSPKTFELAGSFNVLISSSPIANDQTNVLHLPANTTAWIKLR